MNKSALILIIFLFVTSTVFSQKIKLGEISKEDLRESYYSLDSSANAVFLYNYRYTYIDGQNLVTEVHHKIKIYNKEGLNFATKKIRLSKNGGTRERVVGLKAYTYNLVNDEIVKRALSNDAIFKTEYHKRLNHYTFTMPNVKEKAIIEYKYKIMSPYFTNIDEYKFQYAIPVKKLYSKLYTPAFFKYKSKTKGFLPILPKYSSKRDARIGRMVNITEYKMSNVPALLEEKYVDNIENYRSGVEYELVAVHYTTRTKYYSQTWEDVAKSINQFDTFKHEIKKKSYYKDDIDNLLAGVTDKEEKIKKIFAFVKSKVKWNSIEGLYTFNGMQKAYKTGIGNTGDINLMLISMMRYAGLIANPVLTSTKDNGIPVYPTIDGLNYIVCGIELNKKTILLDATNQFSNQNILPVNVLNWSGKLIRPDNTIKTVDLQSENPSLKYTYLDVKILTDGSVEGKIRNMYKDHYAFQFRENYSKTSNEEYLLEKENLNGNIEISEHTLKNLENIDKSLVEIFSFSKENHIEIIDDKMYLSPLFFFTKDQNPFVTEKRLFPVDFLFPWNQKFQIQIETPEGYEIGTIPKPIKIKMPNGVGEFTYLAKKASNTSIQLICSTKINYPVISSSQYEFLQTFYNEIIRKESEKIILSKI